MSHQVFLLLSAWPCMAGLFWGSMFANVACLQNAAPGLRWNNAKLKELRDEEETTSHRQRAGRWVKWREMTESAARESEAKIKIPSAIETLAYS